MVITFRTQTSGLFCCVDGRSDSPIMFIHVVSGFISVIFTGELGKQWRGYVSITAGPDLQETLATSISLWEIHSPYANGHYLSHGAIHATLC